jgi:ABC-2 type transport system ATP-binding protein
MPAEPAVETVRLHKRYGDVHALRGVDLRVDTGTVYGLLGPNGAGKTTAVRILTTLLPPDEGSARVAGFDVLREAAKVRRQIGLAGQYAAVDENLTGFENLELVGRLYHLGRRPSRERARELLDSFDLADAADRLVRTYSGGMRRRIDIAVALVVPPRVLFLDEPTTGLDPRGRNEVWETVREVAASGTTVLLTTQYLDEADQLAAEISVMNHGRIIAGGTPEALKRRIGGDRVTVTLPSPDALDVLAGRFADATVDAAARTVTFEVGSGVVALAEIVRVLDQLDLTPEDLVLRRPTLDEVFLTLTAAGEVAR